MPTLFHFRIRTLTFVPWLTAFTRIHQKHIWCSCQVLTSSPPPDRKYFSLQGHMAEGLGDSIWAVFRWCWVVLVLFCALCLSHLLLPSLCLFSFITYCGSSHATSGPFGCGVLVRLMSRYWQYLFWSVKACLRHCPESLVGKGRYHYINNINNGLCK